MTLITASTTAGEFWIVNSTVGNRLRNLTIKTNYGTNDTSSGSGSITISGGNRLSLDSGFRTISVSDSSTNYKSTSLTNYLIRASWNKIEAPIGVGCFGYLKSTGGGTSGGEVTYYPAVALRKIEGTDLDTLYTDHVLYLNNSGSRATGNSNSFIPLIADGNLN